MVTRESRGKKKLGQEGKEARQSGVKKKRRRDRVGTRRNKGERECGQERREQRQKGAKKM